MKSSSNKSNRRATYATMRRMIFIYLQEDLIFLVYLEDLSVQAHP